MSTLLIGLAGALVATNQPAALSNLVTATTGISITVPAATNNPIELELKRIMDDDDAAAEEVDAWILENQEFAAKGAGVSDESLNQRIRKRFKSVRQSYEDFIKRHPDNAKARIAFASFLNAMGDEDEELAQLEKGRELDPKNPAAWNQMANYHGHRGPTTNAFLCYEKAIELDPTEPVYYQNFGTTVYLFRQAAMEHYHITEQQVFNKALDLYAQALKLDPTNFALATDVAQTYYGIRPVRNEAALNAWTNALNLAGNEFDREGVFVHLARFKYTSGRIAEARGLLGAVTNSHYGDLKQRLLRNIAETEAAAGKTNPPTAAATGAATNEAVSLPPKHSDLKTAGAPDSHDHAPH